MFYCGTILYTGIKLLLLLLLLLYMGITNTYIKYLHQIVELLIYTMKISVKPNFCLQKYELEVYAKD